MVMIGSLGHIKSPSKTVELIGESFKVLWMPSESTKNAKRRKEEDFTAKGHCGTP